MTGFLILKASLIWVVIVQLRLDEALFRYSRRIDDLPSMQLVFYCERLLLKGISVMYIGMFVTIAIVVGLIMCLVAFLYYFKGR
jgi:hypothetical protein